MTRKRDMDLIRSLMLEIEGGKASFEPISDEEADMLGIQHDGPPMSDEEAERLEMHLQLIEEAKFVIFARHGGNWVVDRITGKGHDFLDSVRDPAIWGKAKESAKKVGGLTLELIVAAAKGYLKKQFQSHMGFDMEF